jgi:hypothetical protein
MKTTVFWNVAPCSVRNWPTFQRCLPSAIALMMEGVTTSETSVNFYETIRRNIPEDSNFHTTILSICTVMQSVAVL